MNASDRLTGIASLLFVPAGNDRLLASALNRPADGFVLDLEDAIPPEQKDAARQGLSADVTSLRSSGAQVGVRVNRPWTLLVPDLTACVAAGVDFVMVPKVDTPQFVVAVAEILRELGAPPQIYTISQIESAVAFGRLTDIAAAAPERQAALMIGPEDLAVDLGAESSQTVMAVFAQMMVAAARGAGLVPIGSPGSIAEIGDMAAYWEQMELGRRMGFGAAVAIHPRQVDVINAVFTPSLEAVASAREIVTRDAEHGGQPFLHHGRMVDAPVVARAARTIALVEARKNAR